MENRAVKTRLPWLLQCWPTRHDDSNVPSWILGKVANIGGIAWTALKLFPLLCAETAISFSKWNVPFGMFFYHLHFADRRRVGRTNFERKIQPSRPQRNRNLNPVPFWYYTVLSILIANVFHRNMVCCFVSCLKFHKRWKLKRCPCRKGVWTSRSWRMPYLCRIF